jgi:hypothetical protein
LYGPELFKCSKGSCFELLKLGEAAIGKKKGVTPIVTHYLCHYCFPNLIEHHLKEQVEALLVLVQ